MRCKEGNFVIVFSQRSAPEGGEFAAFGRQAALQ
jgi:hypothetical protein